ncbi:MAG TPA: aldo/keto reductase [Bacteroidales bacterium]|nr:aldo/keto reductase [Bacteroidales bacterium]
MKTNNRRDFLRKSILGVSGAAIAPGLTGRGFLKAGSSPAIPELPVRILGKTGIKTPLISMGTSEATAPGMVRAAYEAGIKLFFSATYYGEGNNEKLVGEGLKGLPRDSFVVGTAVPSPQVDPRTGKFSSPFDAAAYIKKAEESLKRFGLDYVDFVLFPYAGKRETVTNDELLKALLQLKKQGKTKFLGIASHSDTVEALKAAADCGVYDIAMPAYNFKSTEKDALNTAIGYAAGKGMGIVAMKTTAGVFRSKSGPVYNSNAILKWVLQNQNITSIVSGMSNLEQMQKNILMIGDIKLTDQEMKDISMYFWSGEPGLYCQQCRECLPQCAENIDIPTFMRSYMYAYGYRNSRQAWNLLAEEDMPQKPCESCDDCKVICKSGFNVKERIQDISRLKKVPGELLFT